MANVLSGTELARPFIPAKDFERSKRFYVKLGFEKVLDSDVAIFRIASTSFILQPFDHAENFMMQLMVDDLDARWAHINALDLENEFGVSAPRAPAIHLGGYVLRTSSTLPVCFGTWRNSVRACRRTCELRTRLDIENIFWESSTRLLVGEGSR